MLFCIFTYGLHFVSACTVFFRSIRDDKYNCSGDLPPVTIIRPISGLDHQLYRTLRSTFELEAQECEILLCAARVDDPAVAIARGLLEEYPNANARLLVGDEKISGNPKLNNCVKGWNAASNEFIILIDSNVMLPSDYLHQMFRAWKPGCGLVSSPPVGDAPENFWASVECAFLNTHQARWQLFADELGIAFAQGKNLMFRYSILESMGGLARLAQEPAEDAGATKAIRSAALKIRLSTRPFAQPLGKRSISELFYRQARWARLRRSTFPILYFPEIFSGSLLPIIAGIVVAWHADFNPSAAFGISLVYWYGIEVLLAYVMGWNLSLISPMAMIVRDMMLPMVWFTGIASNSFEWQGHRMSTNREHSQQLPAE
jgi:ceramide glucosyltransferase